MIKIAAVLSAIWIIFVLLLLNASVGFWQEHKAENAIELLKKKLALKAKVLRDGKWQEIPSKELVPGDVVRVRLGDIIPASRKTYFRCGVLRFRDPAGRNGRPCSHYRDEYLFWQDG